MLIFFVLLVLLYSLLEYPESRICCYASLNNEEHLSAHILSSLLNMRAT